MNIKPIAVGLVFGDEYGIGFKELATWNYVWNNFLCST